jgi:hypothetical protein
MLKRAMFMDINAKFVNEIAIDDPNGFEMLNYVNKNFEEALKELISKRKEESP